MGRLRTAMEARYEDRGVDHKVYTPGNLETLELSIRHERIAKVRFFPNGSMVIAGYARLSGSLLRMDQGKVTSCLACLSQRIAPIHSWMCRS